MLCKMFCKNAESLIRICNLFNMSLTENKEIGWENKLQIPLTIKFFIGYLNTKIQFLSF